MPDVADRAVFHSVEKSFPRCGKNGPIFPRNGKIFPDFSTQWKKSFHTVENFRRGLLRPPTAGGAVRLLVAAMGLWLVAVAGAAAPTGAEPTLALDKKIYVLGEAIRFWIGVARKGNEPIPEIYWSTCVLHVTRPDGTRADSAVSWPSDGALDLGWTGGQELREEEIQLGTYSLSFEFAGKQTPPVDLVVRELPALRDVAAEFVFGARGAVGADDAIPVVLRVANHTPQLLRFPVFGAIGTTISLRIYRTDPPRGESLFYPDEWLPDPKAVACPEAPGWRHLAHTPFIALPPGETYEVGLSIRPADRFWGPGEYEVEFTTTIPLLLGEPDGEFADVCPIRLRVSAKEDFTRP